MSDETVEVPREPLERVLYRAETDVEWFDEDPDFDDSEVEELYEAVQDIRDAME